MGQSRPQRWAEAIAKASEGIDALVELQQEYQEIYDNQPEGLKESPFGQKLEAITQIDLEGAKDAIDEAEGIDLPLGFGRD